MNLYKYVSEKINEKLGMTVNLESPRNREFGDFATNAAMVMAKNAGKNPRELAGDIANQLRELDFVADASVAGPGFINIKLRNNFIWKNATAPKQIAAQKPMVIDLDYGAYNVAKSLHIGHLRTSIVGDTFNRTAKFIGHKTFSWNHIGDWGKPMGLIIAWIERLHPELPYFSDNFDPNMPVDYEIDTVELNTYYPSASKLAKEDADFQARAQEIKAKFQDGHAGYFALYEKFLAISLAAMNNTVKRLNILPFDYDLGERNAAQYLDDVEKILRAKNMIYESDGALVINVRRDDDTAPMPPYMWRDSRGADTYDSTDLAAVFCRKKKDNPDKIIYFTDLRQSLHFEQLFRAADMSGIYPYEKMEHIGYGTINGSDGKPFKTRDGNAAGLDDILDLATVAVRERVAESGKSLDDETINSIALAAVKFNDLLHDVRSDYIFDPKSITSFEGRTGPYILYTAVRLNSILKKADAQTTEPATYELTADERNLLIQIMDFERTVISAFDNRATDLIANYAYDLCQLINTFYHNCPIMRDDVDETVKAGRLHIVRVARDTLATAIDLMGLKVPSEM
ncbi:MAG: arginine--tRNA ligase [Alphaproteobacteria bacterium]|nr:arginine--tRNA ligase [Alphaproteobacteria bacterium]